jgi:hypothetical protein
MFKLLKKTVSNENVVAEPKADLRGKTINKVIEEIHENFYTEVDRLLASALVANSLDTDKDELIEKCNRLKALGFSNTQEVKEAEKEIARLDNLKRDNEAKKTLIEAINYFSFKYPNYKFITEESVKKICAKYSLIYGEISRYTGTVPNKNLAQMEEFKVVEDDECFVEEDLMFNQWQGGWSSIRKKFKSFATWEKEKEMESDIAGLRLSSHHSIRSINMKCPLEIAAPLKDFNMKGMEVKDFKISKIEIPDPIVLKPVIFNNQKHYLIVTAWE